MAHQMVGFVAPMRRVQSRRGNAEAPSKSENGDICVCVSDCVYNLQKTPTERKTCDDM